MIELQELTRRYADKTAVDRLSLEVRDGETCVLIGPSGCGKTTTLRMINRLLEPTSGRVLIGGVDAATIDPVELRRGLGYAIQSVGLFPHLTVRDNIATVPRLLGWDDARIGERAEELLALVRLEPAAYLGKYPRQLSGGEAQRVGVARALAADPPVLLMDEPFGAVDPLTRERLQIEFARIQRELHKTVVFVTHDVDEAIRLADRIAVMRDGRLLQYDTPENVLDHPADKFVHDFMGADRALKRLVRVRVTDVLEPAPRIRPGEPVSSAEPPVTDGRMFVYVVDAEDRLAGWVDGREMAAGRSVEEATTRVDRAVAAVPGDATLKEALSAMLGLGFRHIAVIDAEGRLLGEVGFDAIDRVLASGDARRAGEGA
ncbi:MAG TPA: ABC transporter ATP-binding protein [Coriobacteriia bacterium]